jgi:Alcohol dehydrogenase, class IV
MKEFMFSVPQKVIYGAKSLNKLPELLKKDGLNKVLIISGPNLNKMGTVGKVAELLETAGISCAIFTDVEANPSVETVDKATQVYKKAEAEAIVALGGGSPMDVAKAVGVLARYGGSVTQYEGADKVPGAIVPLIAIPTTAGTGSEVTAFSVITDHSRNYKLTIFSYQIIPSHAILDPELLVSLPASVTAATGVDALVHAIEAYLSLDASPFTDAMAEKAMELLGANIRAFTANRKDLEAGAAMLTGQMFAGIAFAWARLGDVHAMAHPLSGFFDVSHGVANAILLPVVLKFNALADKGRYYKIYQYLTGRTAEQFKPEMLAEAVRELTISLGLPQTLSEVGVKEEKIPAMAADAMKSGNIAVNPRSTTQKEVETLYHEAM